MPMTVIPLDKFLERMVRREGVEVGADRDTMLSWAAREAVNGKAFKLLSQPDMSMVETLLRDDERRERIMANPNRDEHTIAMAAGRIKHAMGPDMDIRSTNSKMPASDTIVNELLGLGEDISQSRRLQDVARDENQQALHIKQKILEDPLLQIQAQRAWVAAGKPKAELLAPEDEKKWLERLLVAKARTPGRDGL